MEKTTIQLQKIGTNKYKLEKLPGMKAEVIVYIKPQMLNQIQNDPSLKQLAEAAMIADVVSPVVGMPDIHKGFGLPIGGIMATNNLISVGAVGMDINCGVRLMATNLQYDPGLFSLELLKTLMQKIEKGLPIGLGGERKTLPPKVNLKDVILKGAQAIVETGYGQPEDLQAIEEGGKVAGAKYDALSPKAIKRAEKQIGSLGSGNHFIEIQKIEEIFDLKIASSWGLKKGQICFMLHCGSRALGHQTCLDYTKIFWQARHKYKIELPRRGLAALPIQTPEGQNYFAAMTASINFAFANRQLLMFDLEKIVQEFFKEKKENVQLRLIYDVAHNIAKWENHQGKKVLVHRKGATRALPAGHPQNPPKYAKTGHPALIPGSMGSPSYIVVGTPKAQETYFSVNHGAGRAMSRKEAFKAISEATFKESMGKVVYNLPFRKIVDEAPIAYKNIQEVVDTLVEAGITKKIIKLTPLAVVKGG